MSSVSYRNRTGKNEDFEVGNILLSMISSDSGVQSAGTRSRATNNTRRKKDSHSQEAAQTLANPMSPYDLSKLYYTSKKREIANNSVSVSRGGTRRSRVRFMWSFDLHQTFIAAIFDIGLFYVDMEIVREILLRSELGPNMQNELVLFLNLMREFHSCSNSKIIPRLSAIRPADANGKEKHGNGRVKDALIANQLSELEYSRCLSKSPNLHMFGYHPLIREFPFQATLPPEIPERREYSLRPQLLSQSSVASNISSDDPDIYSIAKQTSRVAYDEYSPVPKKRKLLFPENPKRAPIAPIPTIAPKVAPTVAPKPVIASKPLVAPKVVPKPRVAPKAPIAVEYDLSCYAGENVFTDYYHPSSNMTNHQVFSHADITHSTNGLSYLESSLFTYTNSTDSSLNEVTSSLASSARIGLGSVPLFDFQNEGPV